jgi:predicted MPP superfamily phosphohydrolase
MNTFNLPVHSYALVYLAVVSLLAVVLTARDKNAARKKARRVSERTLLTIALLGGSTAMLLMMLALRHKTRRAKFMVGIPLIILGQAAIILFAFNQNLTVSHYRLETAKISGQVKLALVTDYHSCAYGDGQNQVLTLLDTEQPDAVLLCGDIFDHKLPPGNTIELIAGLAGRYPCYYVSGNHEFWSGKADEFKVILESYGIKVLEGMSEIWERGGARIRISGIDDPDTDRYPSRALPYAEQIKGLSAALDAGVFTILLSHRPERIDEFLPLEPDLVLSGHAHGGQWRIPFILENGLFSPNQGLFPKLTGGEYFFGDTELIVSRGLARESTAVPRLFNRPEIVVITLQGK